MQKNNVEFPARGVKPRKRIEYAADFRREGYIVLEDRGQFILARRNAFQRLSVAEMTSDHAVRKRTAALAVAGFPVHEGPIFFAQIAPVDGVKNLEFDTQSVELTVHRPPPLFGARQVDDDALHRARRVGHCFLPLPSFISRSRRESDEILLIPARKRYCISGAILAFLR